MVRRSRCVVLLALCFIWASAYGDHHSENDCKVHNNSCETHKLSTVLGSTVLLPCNFSKNHSNIVSWVHSPEVTVVTVTSDGRVNFFDPRSGRVNAFPNHGSQGNLSISIDDVASSDLGCYRCEMGNKCIQVELALKTESDSKHIWFPFYIYIISGVATLIVLSIACFLCVKYLMKKNRETEETCSITFHEFNDGISLPVEESGRVHWDGHQRGEHQQRSGTYVNDTVYENDGHDEPDYLNEIPGRVADMNRSEASHSSQVNFARGESQRSKQRFHTELLNRLRQASIRKHYYVNQDELCNKQDTATTKGAKKKKAYCQYPNPIYNRSTDNLDQM